jgi:uncharacterized protein (DUF849 family)
MVKKMARILRELDFELATPKETRDILKLKGKEHTSFK